MDQLLQRFQRNHYYQRIRNFQSFLSFHLSPKFQKSLTNQKSLSFHLSPKFQKSLTNQKSLSFHLSLMYPNFQMYQSFQRYH
jgi:hypothetical protein